MAYDLRKKRSFRTKPIYLINIHTLTSLHISSERTISSIESLFYPPAMPSL